MTEHTATFKVTDREAPYRAVDPGIEDKARAIAAEAAARSPRETGTLAAGWTVQPGRETAARVVANAVPYARFVEYGTRYRPATPMLGPALAAHRAGGAG